MILWLRVRASAFHQICSHVHFSLLPFSLFSSIWFLRYSMKKLYISFGRLLFSLPIYLLRFLLHLVLVEFMYILDANRLGMCASVYVFIFCFAPRKIISKCIWFVIRMENLLLCVCVFLCMNFFCPSPFSRAFLFRFLHVAQHPCSNISLVEMQMQKFVLLSIAVASVLLATDSDLFHLRLGGFSIMCSALCMWCSERISIPTFWRTSILKGQEHFQ